jgi:hypothetical protein
MDSFIKKIESPIVWRSSPDAIRSQETGRAGAAEKQKQQKFMYDLSDCTVTLRKLEAAQSGARTVRRSSKGPLKLGLKVWGLRAFEVLDCSLGGGKLGRSVVWRIGQLEELVSD